MASNTKVLDPAFQGAGQKIGTEIWRIENFEPVPLPKSEHGKFYMGDSYIVLQTSPGKGGAYLFDIHYWIGKDTSQDEAGTAAIKTIELDTALGGRAVQHRELQGHESDKFISYFKPCIIPLEGGVATGFKKVEEEKFETRLYVCKGKRAVKLKQVPFARSSLNHDDVFILDTENKIYQFNGENSNIQERAKALEVIQFFKEKYHDGTCEVAIVDDGNLRTESDSGEFWLLFGGFAPIGKKIASDDDITLERTPGKLYSITDGQVALVEGSLSKGMLENYKCYLLDCGAEVFIWVGRVTQVEERKAASQAAEEFISSENRPRSTRITRVIQGYETHAFKSNFESWPAGAVASSTAEDGRGKVAALLKQQALGAKGTAKTTAVNEEVPPLLENGGKLEVWRINGSAKTPVPKEEIGKFYSGDCYIVLYTYHAGDKKEDYFLSCWIGKDSVQEEQMMASRLANTMSNSFKGRPVQGRVFQGKEPPQFVAIFQPMVVLKGGISSGYRKSIEDKGVNDDSYSTDGVALIRIAGTSLHNNKAVQVDTVASSLNSNDCFLLQTGSSLFTWHGNQSTAEQQQLTAKIAEFLKPDVAMKYTKEGTESSAFWHALGGKQSYTSKQESQEIVRDPHLYTYSFNKGKFEVTEIYNFSQDDLLTEDMLILNTLAEVFVWVGQSVDSKEKQKAFEIGQTYIELASALDGLSPDVALYKVTEGNEPCFFTTYFSWDFAKAHVQGNSFQKKLASLFGGGHAVEDKSNGSNSGGPTQRASALAALNSAFSPSSGGTKTAVSRPSSSTRGSSQRAAAIAALSGVLTAEQKKPSPDVSPSRARGSPVRKARDAEEKSESTASEVEAPPEVSEVVEEVKETVEEVKETMEDEVESVSISENNGEDTEEKQEEPQADEIAAGSTTFSYDQLRSKSTDPAQGIDFKQREAYLSDEEFQTVLGMTREAFYKQPKWKQDMQKKKVELF
ncbi:hypothetical protein C5167_046252 [Papaver somniferum]|uniref:HP domain-containing protein n=1 Tax=Papaver somniferum TaxID=3469 RepID=A0A4Y7LE11_PAPSO|nr:villin-2-like [Papaver somniferum]RZC83466.1 hypothetical protein C5167_046252 [Papaver somniferum]